MASKLYVACLLNTIKNTSLYMYMYVRYLSHTIVEIVEVSVHVCSVLIGQ